MTIRGKIDGVLRSRGHDVRKPHFNADDNTYCLRDDNDGRGPYIWHWGANLGPKPTEADGFTASEVRAPRTAEENKAERKARKEAAMARMKAIKEEALTAARKLNRDGSTVGWLGIARDKMRVGRPVKSRAR